MKQILEYLQAQNLKHSVRSTDEGKEQIWVERYVNKHQMTFIIQWCNLNNYECGATTLEGATMIIYK